MTVQWGLLANAPDPGAAFLAGVDKGREARLAAQKREALAAYGMGDPGALNALMQADPALGIQLRGQEQQRAGAEREALMATTQTAAEMISRAKAANPQMPDEQIYSTVRSTLVRMGAPGADKAPEQFDPQYYQGILSMAKPAAGREPPSSVQEYEYAKQGGFDGSYMNFIDAKRPQFMSGPAGIFDTRAATQPQGGAAPTGGGPQPGTIEDGHRFKGGDPADENNWEPAAGGPTQPASGGFPF